MINISEIDTIEQLDDLSLKIRQRRAQLTTHQNHRLVLDIKEFICKMVRNPEMHKDYTIREYFKREFLFSYGYLSNLFYRCEDISIMKYMRQERMSFTKELLYDNSLNLTEIASMSGFSSIGHMSNEFKKIEGIRPLEWRVENTQVKYYKNRHICH